MWESFKEFILTQCNKNPTRIVEVGVGRYFDVYDFLNKEENIEIFKTDINPKDDATIKDDIAKPNLELYRNVDIIYSIRPPYEIQPHLYNLAKKINSTLIIKPLFNEDLNIKANDIELKNYKKSSFYIRCANDE
ncbi:MAG: hypothetical protein E7Z73_07365 [Methanobrevibacter millerae]|uniref:UPF0146 protein E7Z73_07365 n=1 Tax=Methanobrevibacter millerae TaxID=230361 RepID=A0A8T3VLI6_9EURY|nr:UPF0146 family protein [Methanobrevibacter millerae]MBE6505540.1 hypothetical protein [Methanobrevibacter millerae]